LSGSHFDVFELQHPLEIVRLRHEKVGGQDLLDDGADTGQRQMCLTPSAAFDLEKAVGDGRQDDVALPSRQAPAFEVVEAEGDTCQANVLDARAVIPYPPTVRR